MMSMHSSQSLKLAQAVMVMQPPKKFASMRIRWTRMAMAILTEGIAGEIQTLSEALYAEIQAYATEDSRHGDRL